MNISQSISISRVTLLLPLFAMIVAVNISCKRGDGDVENPEDHNEEELITTVALTFEKAGGGTTTAQWSDLDGDGGSAPVIDTIRLDSNALYHLSIEFLDESGFTAEDITVEVAEEADDHMVCFETNGANLTIERTDSDGQYELGLKSDWITHSPMTGSAVISLMHQPDVKDGTCNVGETDVEVTFPVVVQ